MITKHKFISCALLALSGLALTSCVGDNGVTITTTSGTPILEQHLEDNAQNSCFDLTSGKYKNISGVDQINYTEMNITPNTGLPLFLNSDTGLRAIHAVFLNRNCSKLLSTNSTTSYQFKINPTNVDIPLNNSTTFLDSGFYYYADTTTDFTNALTQMNGFSLTATQDNTLNDTLPLIESSTIKQYTLSNVTCNNDTTTPYNTSCTATVINNQGQLIPLSSIDLGDLGVPDDIKQFPSFNAKPTIVLIDNTSNLSYMGQLTMVNQQPLNNTLMMFNSKNGQMAQKLPFANDNFTAFLIVQYQYTDINGLNNNKYANTVHIELDSKPINITTN